MNNCGNCQHGKLDPKNLNNLQVRICRGAPPHPMLIPQPNGTLNMQAFYPMVGATDEPCGLYLAKPPFVLSDVKAHKA